MYVAQEGGSPETRRLRMPRCAASNMASKIRKNGFGLVSKLGTRCTILLPPSFLSPPYRTLHAIVPDTVVTSLPPLERGVCFCQ